MAILLKASVFHPLPAGTELSRFNLANIMVAEALAPCVARSSTPMILTIDIDHVE